MNAEHGDATFVFKMWKSFEWVLRQISMLCHFCRFLSCILGVFNSPVASPAHVLSPSLRV